MREYLSNYIQEAIRSAFEPVAEARRDLLRQIDLHAGRLRADLHQRLESEIQQFRFSLENWVDRTAAQIEEAIRLAARAKEEGETKLTATLHAVQEEIDFISRMSDQLRISCSAQQSKRG